MASTQIQAAVGGTAAEGRRPVAPPGVPSEEEVLGRAGGENFVVASRALLGPHRTALLAVYGFARLVDDIGDRSIGNRLALLDWADAELDRAARGAPCAHPVFDRLGPVITRWGLEPELMHRLIEANRQDQLIQRYETFADLVEYCRLSAEPIGRLVLAVFGADDPENLELSDSVCTGLQVVEHCQDVMEDARAGRVYLPVDDLDRVGLTPEDVLALARPAGPDGGEGAASARSTAKALTEVVQLQADRASGLLHRGAPLTRRLTGRSRWAVAGFIGGGLAALDALRAAGYDVSGGPPVPSKARRLRLSARALRGAA